MKLINHFSGDNHIPVRIYPTNSCNFYCTTPKSTRFCDHEYSPMVNPPETFGKIARLFKENDLSRIAKLSGREPTLYPGLLPLIEALGNTMDKVTLSTNGSSGIELLDQCIDKGVSVITVPIPSLIPEKYALSIGFEGNGGRRYFDRLLSTLDELKTRDVELHFIRVLMRNFNDSIGEMNEFLEFSREYSALSKIFDLNYHPKLHVTWEMDDGKDSNLQDKIRASARVWRELHSDLDPYFQDFASRAKKREEFFNQYSRRKVTVFELDDGSRILMDHRAGINTKELHDHESCKNCPYRQFCNEGPFSNGWEITPDLHLQPCPMRPDLSIDVSNPNKISAINYERGTINVSRDDN